MRRGKVVTLGTLAGLAIGATAGILFAPEKGSETRKQIKDKSDEYMHELNSKLNEVRDTLARKLKSTKRDAENLAEKGKANYQDAKKEVQNAASDFNHSVS